MMVNLTKEQAIIPPAIFAINQALKNMGMPSKFAPVVNIVLGVVFNVAITWHKASLVEAILVGIVAGTMTGGAYDVKKVREG